MTKDRSFGSLALVIMVTFGLLFAACCPAPTGENVYSKFGFSFEYPAGVTLIEEGMYSATADEYSGMVSWYMGDDYFSISWEKTVLWSSELAEIYIDGGILGMEIAGGVIELSGVKVTSSISGFDVMYQLFNLTVQGEEYNGIIAVWYCEPGARLFGAIFFTGGATLPYLEDFMLTFSC